VNPRLLLVLVGLATLLGLLWLNTGNESEPAWLIHAHSSMIIGGYGDNFAYSGENVRSVEGALELRLKAARQVGKITVSLQTSEESGPFHMSVEQSFDGEITLVSQIDRSSSVSEEVFIHGDTGIGGPELPRTYATVVGWSRFDVFVDGIRMYEDLSGEWALIQALRKNDGAIRQSGLLYSPLLRDKRGFADPEASEFVLLLHSGAEDSENLPPYEVALHVVFTDVTIEIAPLKVLGT
jgi:hypothetical protein